MCFFNMLLLCSLTASMALKPFNMRTWSFSMLSQGRDACLMRFSIHLSSPLFAHNACWAWLLIASPLLFLKCPNSRATVPWAKITLLQSSLLHCSTCFCSPNASVRTVSSRLGMQHSRDTSSSIAVSQFQQGLPSVDKLLMSFRDKPNSPKT